VIIPPGHHSDIHEVRPFAHHGALWRIALHIDKDTLEPRKKERKNGILLDILFNAYQRVETSDVHRLTQHARMQGVRNPEE